MPPGLRHSLVCSFQSRRRGSAVQHVEDTTFHLHQDKEGTTCKTVQHANPVSRQNQARDSQREGKMNHRSVSALPRGQGTVCMRVAGQEAGRVPAEIKHIPGPVQGSSRWSLCSLELAPPRVLNIPGFLQGGRGRLDQVGHRGCTCGMVTGMWVTPRQGTNCTVRRCRVYPQSYNDRHIKPRS